MSAQRGRLRRAASPPPDGRQGAGGGGDATPPAAGAAGPSWGRPQLGVRTRRIGAYGVCRDQAGRMLLVRTTARASRPGTWYLPGGRVEQGEHPVDAVLREVAEETGLRVTVVRARVVAAELVARDHDRLEHTDGIVYDLEVAGGTLRPEAGGTTDLARWVPPADAAELPLSRFAALALGLPPPAEPYVPPPPQPRSAEPPEPRPRRGQRFGAYGLVTDPAQRVLLTLNAEGYPGAGRWHLPGGGTDFGEQPTDALRREITEESGQVGRVDELLTIVHRHNPAALGPEGYPIDWHSVAAVFEVAVPEPSPPRVVVAGGSTAQAAWFTRAELAALPLTELAAALLSPTGSDYRDRDRDK